MVSRVSVCSCGAPLVWTFHFRGAEYYCLDCGRLYGMFDCDSEPETAELVERLAAYKAEWEANAGAKVLTPGAWHQDCHLCAVHDGDHLSHATPAEAKAHADAEAWIDSRRTS